MPLRDGDTAHATSSSTRSTRHTRHCEESRDSAATKSFGSGLFFYWGDDGSLVALRYDNWKIVFQEQRAHGFDVWQEPFVPLRLPKIFNLRSDPFELADQVAINYGKWRIDRTFLLVPAQQIVGQFIATFKEFPPSQKVGSFSLDQVLESLSTSAGK